MRLFQWYHSLFCAIPFSSYSLCRIPDPINRCELFRDRLYLVSFFLSFTSKLSSLFFFFSDIRIRLPLSHSPDPFCVFSVLVHYDLPNQTTTTPIVSCSSHIPSLLLSSSKSFFSFLSFPSFGSSLRPPHHKATYMLHTYDVSTPSSSSSSLFLTFYPLLSRLHQHP